MSSLPRPITATSSAARNRSLTFTGLFFVFLLVLVSIKLITDRGYHVGKKMQAKRQFQLGGALGGSWEQPVFKLFSDSEAAASSDVDEAKPVPSPEGSALPASSTLSLPKTLSTFATLIVHQGEHQVQSTDIPKNEITAWAEPTSTSTFWTVGLIAPSQDTRFLTEYQPGSTNSHGDDDETSSSQIMITLWDPVYASTLTEPATLTTLLTSLTGTVSTAGTAMPSAAGPIETQQELAAQSSANILPGNEVGLTKVKLGQVVVILKDTVGASPEHVPGSDSAGYQDEEKHELRTPAAAPSGVLGRIVNGLHRVMQTIKLRLSSAHD